MGNKRANYKANFIELYTSKAELIMSKGEYIVIVASMLTSDPKFIKKYEICASEALDDLYFSSNTYISKERAKKYC